MFAPAPALQLTTEERGELERIARNPHTGQKAALRARIILLGADGMPNVQIAERLRVSRPTVILQRQRFGQLGVKALLKDASRRPGRAPVAEELVQKIVDATRTTPPVGATQWTARSMAKWAGTSRMVVHRIWKRHGLQPHRVETFKMSTDPHLVAKVRDVVGLYLDPPDRALVFSVDEKTSIQALDRTQPGLPIKPGRCATKTHDYKRHGTTTLYAALNVLDGKVIGHCVPRCCAKEFIKFLAKIHRATPADLDLHVIVDNSSTHKTQEVQTWLRRHRRFHLHFTPTSGSWLNLVESWFAILTKQRIRRGVFHSVPELIAAIDDYLRLYNATPTQFAWTKDADEILAKIERARRVLTRKVGK
jgi:transposase/DNA-binding CsgD family transcriptional regulator